MILPSHKKYDESRKQPYQALMDRLGRVLAQDGALLVTCGFSFSDQHVNSLIFNVLDNRPLSHVITLQYSDLSEDSAIVRAAKGRPNLMVLGPNGGVLRGSWATWKLLEPVDNRTATFMDTLFDNDAVVEAGVESLTGRLRAGDFNWFCRFLAAMAEFPGDLS